MDAAHVNLWSSPAHALDYLARADAVPHRTEGEGALLECLPRPLRRVLDLGSGGGRLLALVKLARPEAAAVAIDFSVTMIDRMRERFAADSSVSVIAHDMDDPLPASLGTFDAIVSSFAIHHLTHERKRAIYAEVWSARTGGAFCNLEHAARRRRRYTSSSSLSRPARRIRRTNCWTWTHSLHGSAPSASSTSIAIGNGASWRCSQAENPALTRPAATDPVLTGMSVRRFRSLARSWEGLGRTDPLFGILSDPAKWGGKWDADEFFASGRAHVEKLLRSLREIGAWFKNDTCLDFGCGVGRLTVPLSESFDRTIGVDVARSMIDQARRYHSASSRCEFLLNRDLDLRQFTDATFDFALLPGPAAHTSGYSHPHIEGILFASASQAAGWCFSCPKRAPESVIFAQHALRTRPDVAGNRPDRPAGLARVSGFATLGVMGDQRQPGGVAARYSAVPPSLRRDHWRRRTGMMAMFDDARARCRERSGGESFEVQLGVQARRTGSAPARGRSCRSSCAGSLRRDQKRTRGSDGQLMVLPIRMRRRPRSGRRWGIQPPIDAPPPSSIGFCDPFAPGRRGLKCTRSRARRSRRRFAAPAAT